MKKVLLFIALSLSVVLSAVSDDYRKVLFGNNYKNIVRVDDQEKVAKAVKDISPYISTSIDDWKYEYWVFEEKYDNGTLIRIIGYESFDKFGKREDSISEDNITDWKSLYPTQLIQIAYVNTDNGPCILFQDDIFNKIMNDGTVRSSTGIILRGLEVISRNNNIVAFCEHETVDRTTYYMGFDEEDAELRIERERNSQAYFNRYKTVYKSRKSSINFLMSNDYVFTAPGALIDGERPFRYTIQNMFDNNAGTCFVQNVSAGEEASYEVCFSGKYLYTKQLKIINGLGYDKRSYLENNRIKNIEEAEGRESAVLKDNILTPQYIEWHHLNFTVDDVYAGSKYNDTCISEIDFLVDADDTGKTRYWFFEQ